jgi:ParB family chromosome partitioning protein
MTIERGASAVERDGAVSEEGKRRNLGRGLSALFGEESDDYAATDRQRVGKTVPIGFLRAGRFQPRHRFDDDALRALAESIREKGILQPLLVRRHPDAANSYEIVAGERRWRAAQLAQLHEVPVIIKDLDDRAALEIALVENIQRADLAVLEEAEGYRRLMAEFGHTQDALAKAVGKSRSHVANMMRLLALPDPVKQLLDSGALSAGHARALLGAADPAGLAREIVRRGLNVRQAEGLVKKGKTKRGKAAPAKDADTVALERDLANLLGLKVAISFGGRGGALTVHYRTLEQLDDVIRRLHNEPAG